MVFDSRVVPIFIACMLQMTNISGPTIHNLHMYNVSRDKAHGLSTRVACHVYLPVTIAHIIAKVNTTTQNTLSWKF